MFRLERLSLSRKKSNLPGTECGYFFAAKDSNDQVFLLDIQIPCWSSLRGRYLPDKPCNYG
jgi:hypothetical protein